jgi:hypothetical protein
MNENRNGPELHPYPIHNAKTLTAKDHLDRLKVTHPDLAKELGRIIDGMANAMQAAYVDLHQAEYQFQKIGQFQSSSARKRLAIEASLAGYELKPWDGK